MVTRVWIVVVLTAVVATDPPEESKQLDQAESLPCDSGNPSLSGGCDQEGRQRDDARMHEGVTSPFERDSGGARIQRPTSVLRRKRTVAGFPGFPGGAGTRSRGGTRSRARESTRCRAREGTCPRTPGTRLNQYQLMPNDVSFVNGNPSFHCPCALHGIKQRITVPHCGSVWVYNMACVGSCHSYDIPRMVTTSNGELCFESDGSCNASQELAKSCSTCKARRTRSTNLTVPCYVRDATDGPRTVTIAFDEVIRCRCTTCP